MFESVKICWVSSHLTNTFAQLKLPIKMTPNIRGVDLDFETLEEEKMKWPQTWEVWFAIYS